MTGYIALSYWDLALASVLVLIDAGLSIIFGLKIHRSLLVAAIRMAAPLGRLLVSRIVAGDDRARALTRIG